MSLHMSPLCSPTLQKRPPRLYEPRDLRHQTLIHADVSTLGGMGTEWSMWLQAAGISEIDCTHGLAFQDPGLALQAAIDGLGVAISYLELAAIDLATGRLVQPFPMSIEHPWSYHIVIPEGSVGDNRVAAFRNWLVEELRNDVKRGTVPQQNSLPSA